ncbi:glycosyltransferase family 4 protein [Ralstonia sp. 24A2]|uniref:glycosyltransferase family 4 protein n=1 Tax=Ralstonia sp. 24A2 TaxID=3447364 RepID=UPI003F697343
MKRQRVCVISTIATPLRVFIGPHIKALAEQYDVVLVCDGTSEELDTLLGEHVSFVACPIRRDIALFEDLRCLLWLWRFIRREHFTAVHTIMPKSGLLGMLAAKLGAVPHRFHSFTGQVWATRTGGMRHVLKLMDKLLATCASRLLTDSPSQMHFLIEQGVTSPQNIEVLAHGSICGVDTARFKPNIEKRTVIRTTMGIERDATVFLFVGRVNADKGIVELLAAFSTVANALKNAHLVIVGPAEEDLEVPIAQAKRDTNGRVHRLGFTDHPEDYMAAADVFCLPSHREGFGTVIIEAAATGIPAIASRIYGISDAVIDGSTGMLHPVEDVEAMTSLMIRLASDHALRSRLGEAARQRAHDYFSQDIVVRAMMNFYDRQGVSDVLNQA